jgi:hypothetical protein
MWLAGLIGLAGFAALAQAIELLPSLLRARAPAYISEDMAAARLRGFADLESKTKAFRDLAPPGGGRPLGGALDDRLSQPGLSTSSTMLHTESPDDVKLREWYAPAAEVASKRGLFASTYANDSKETYEKFAGQTVVRDGPGVTAEARHNAEQMTLRLLLATFEEVAPPSRFASADVQVPSLEATKARLIAVLDRDNVQGSRPIGSTVWASVLQTEFTPEFYQPKQSVHKTGRAGIVDYQVESPWLPTANTPVDVDGAAAKVVTAYQVRALYKRRP